jgi:ferric-dicitrate binding protein FerR (iron transport regulator)
VRSKENSSAKILFNNGTKITLGKNSRLKILSYDKNSAVIELTNGKAFVTVKGGANAVFLVQTPVGGRIECTGDASSVYIQINDYGTMVYLKEGTAKVFNKSFEDAYVVLSAGSLTLIPPQNPPHPPTKTPVLEMKNIVEEFSYEPK